MVGTTLKFTYVHYYLTENSTYYLNLALKVVLIELLCYTGNYFKILFVFFGSQPPSPPPPPDPNLNGEKLE